MARVKQRDPFSGLLGHRQRAVDERLRARKVAAQLSRLCSTTEKLDPVDSLGKLRRVGEPKCALVLTVGIGPGRDPRGGSAGVDRRPQGLARPACAFPVKRQLGRGPRRAGLGELGALRQDRCEPLVELSPFAREQLLRSDLAHERVAEPDSSVIADDAALGAQPPRGARRGRPSPCGPQPPRAAPRRSTGRRRRRSVRSPA